MKPVAPDVQVANMSEPVTKDIVTTTAAAAEVNEISEDTDDVVGVKKNSHESATCATTGSTEASANEASEGSDLPDEQKSLNRETEASETELATPNDCAEPLDAKQSGKKKKGRKTNWTSVPLDFPPRRPTGRGKGRKRGRGQGLGGHVEEHEPRQEMPASVENLAPIGTRGRGGYRGGRRGGRGRAQPYYRDQSSYLTGQGQGQPYCYYPVAPPMWIVYSQLREQVEFYFYNPKLAEDFFLRRNMDSRGFVELSKIAGFDQVSKIAQGLHNVVGLLVQALQSSELLELSGDKKCVRRRFSPEKWILGNDPSVFSSLRPDAPEFVFEPAAGSKKDTKTDKDQDSDARENGAEKEAVVMNVAQDSDLVEKTAENTENSTDFDQKNTDLLKVEPTGESLETVETAIADVQLANNIKTVENNADDVQNSKEEENNSEGSNEI